MWEHKEEEASLEFLVMKNKFFIDEEGNQRQLTINEVELSSHLPAGTIVEHEVTCSSAFMLHHVPLIAAKMREKMPWVLPTEPIYLVMDNAGGHGTQEAIEEYTRRPLVEFNVVIIWQLACSPEVNALGFRHLDERSITC
jgi:hypothetical protein